MNNHTICDTFVKDFENQNWYLYDDERIRVSRNGGLAVQEDISQRISDSSMQFSPYILFYTLSDGDEELIEENEVIMEDFSKPEEEEDYTQFDIPEDAEDYDPKQIP